MSELSTCVSRCRPALMIVALLSAVSSVLALTGSIFMLTVYDRVIPSGSIPTLIGLGIFAAFLYAMQALLDVFRGRMLTRIGMVIKESLSPRIYDVAVRSAAKGSPAGSSAVRDLDQVQAFMSSTGLTALFDLPWLPIFLGLCFSFHFYIGLAVLVGAVVLIILTLVSNSATKPLSHDLNVSVSNRDTLLHASQVNAETLQAMGMTHAMAIQWKRLSNDVVNQTRRISDVSNSLSSVSKTFRMLLQSFVLAVGAYLVIQQEATGGIIIASSILSARALAPIELTIANWKNFVSARQSWSRLRAIFISVPEEDSRFAAPRPENSLSCIGLGLTIPAARKVVVRDVTFEISAGEGLGIIGPTGSGKSSLARALVGLWEPAAGTVRVDGIELNRWNSVERGRFIGYLPQTVGLFEGTIAENIARFDPEADPSAVVAAARAAGVHEMISHFSDGYDTMIDASGHGLSGGQTQRIGLARALYGDPFILVLDEPNSNLDTDGEAALQRAIGMVRGRGGAVILVTHRPSILSAVDKVLVLGEGRMRAYGPRDEVLESLSGNNRNAASTRKPQISASGGDAS